MVRMRTEQRFALGTRVANPVEGRTGRIEQYDSSTAQYTLIFNDGFRDVVADADVEKYIIPVFRMDAEEAKATESNASAAEDPQQLLGAAIAKTATSYNGKESVVMGLVSSYFPQPRTYRITYHSGSFEDLDAKETKRRVEATKRRAEGSADGQPSSKKHKTNSEAEVIDVNEDPPLSQSDALAIVRRVLYSILSQNGIKPLRTEKQTTVLSNEDIKPKRALKMFVEADGLVALQKVLVLWMRNPSTHKGALLVLKVLAALPGVTAEAVTNSGIGKTLRGIVIVASKMDHVDQVLGDLADWIVHKWKKALSLRPVVPTVRNQIQAKGSEIRLAGAQESIYVAPPSSKKNVTANEAATARMRDLMKQKPPQVVEKPNEEDVEIILPRFNSLGSEDARRPVRQTILLDTLAEKINRDHDEGRKIQEQREAASKKAGGSGAHSVWGTTGNDEFAVGRLKFGKPRILLYREHVAVVDLLATVRSRLMDKSSQQIEEDDSLGIPENEPAESRTLPPPNKTTAPRKSILKVKTNEELVPLSEVKY